ncbi:MAG TPA: GNAT family N-acetyltransferase [Jatrophihabitans sp.]|nr:GNAT family N-acetyltransferase [Jatrophihabitans sp.]
MPPLVRAATGADLASVARIYGHTVRTGVGTFDLTDPPDDYWTAKLDSTQPGDHLLVADDAGVVIGFAYSSAFRSRPAYAQTRETSVYLAPDAVGAGVGSALYAELLRRLRDDGMHVAVAVIAQPNPASVALHEKFGFELVGTLREVGRKFDRWIDTRWYQLRLGQ